MATNTEYTVVTRRNQVQRYIVVDWKLQPFVKKWALPSVSEVDFYDRNRYCGLEVEEGVDCLINQFDFDDSDELVIHQGVEVEEEDWYVPNEVRTTLPFDDRRRERKSKKWISLLKSGNDTFQHLIFSLSKFSIFIRNSYRKFNRTNLVVEPQMDEGAHGMVSQVIPDVKGDIILIDQRGESKGGAVVARSTYDDISTTKQDQIFHSLSERWALFKTFTWTTSNGRGSNLKNFVLPWDFIKEQPDMPNVQLFKVNRLWRGDIVLKFLLSSNRFQNGQLQVSFMYDYDCAEAARYSNIYSASHRAHVLLNAGSSNPGILRIPFNAPTSYLYTAPRGADPVNLLRLVKVDVMVMNMLSVAALQPTSVDVSVFICFENSNFEGLGYRIEPQMESALAAMTIAERGLNLVRKMTDRDFPPNVNPRDVVVVDSGNQIANIMNTADPITQLRSDPAGMTPSIQAPIVEQDFHYLKRIWGMFAMVTWKNSQKTGTLLAAFPSDPELDCDKVSTFGGLETIVLPPFSALSSLYSYYSGDIELRLDFICSPMYSGRIAVVTVPGCVDKTLTWERARASGYSIFDLQSVTQSAHTIPFYSHQPWRKYPLGLGVRSGVYPPSITYIFVVNPLVGMSSLPNEIDINLYARAAENFEVAIPCGPSIAPAFGIFHAPSGVGEGSFVKDFRPCFTSYNTLLNTYLQAGVIRYSLTWCYSTVGNSLCVLNIVSGVVYSVASTIRIATRKGTTFEYKDVPWRSQYYGSRGELLLTEKLFFSEAKQYKGEGVVVFFESEEKAKAYLIEPDPRQAALHTVWWMKDGPWDEYNVDGTKFEVCPQNDIVRNFMTPRFSVHQSRVESQGDERMVVVDKAITVNHPISKTSRSMITFGEDTPTLKALTRRMNLTRTVSGISLRYNIENQPPSFKYLLHPVRTLNLKNNAQADNYRRGGALSVLGSAFAFYRGSLKVKLVFSWSSAKPCNVIVCHRHDVEVKPRGDDILIPDEIGDIYDFADTQFASHVQCLGVNNSVTVSIPFYQNHERNFIQTVASVEDVPFYAMGELHVWVSCIDASNYTCNVFTSLGDDMDFSVFKGFPQMIRLRDIARPKIESQGDESLMPQGAVMGTLQPTPVLDSIEQSSKDLSAAAKSANTFFSKVTSKVDNLYSKATESTIGSIISQNFSNGVQILISILQILNNPTKEVIVLSMCSILVSLFDGVKVAYGKLFEIVTNLYSSLFSGDKVQPQSDDCSVASLVAWLFTAFISLGQFAVKPPKSWKDVIPIGLTIGLSVRSLNPLKDFIQRLFDIVKFVWGWIIDQFSPRDKAIELLMTEKPILKNWMNEVVWLTSPANEDTVYQDAILCQRVFLSAMVSRAMYIQLTTTPLRLANGLVNTYRSLHKKILELEGKLTHRRVFSGARYEPYCLWLGGTAGTGKTYLIQELEQMFGDHLGVTASSSSTITGGQKYWDNCKGANLIQFDDFGAMPPGSNTDIYQQFLQMKSAAPFNPPFSDVIDKDRSLNFQDLVITSNKMFIDKNTLVNDLDAFNRRRDTVVEFRFKQGFDLKKLKDMSSTDRTYCYDTFDHLDVFHYPDPLNNVDCVKLEQLPGKDLKQTVVEFICDQHRSYHACEIKKYYSRCQRATKRLTKVLDSNRSIHENLEKLDTTYNDILQTLCVESDISSVYKRSFFSGYVDSIRQEHQDIKITPQADDDLEDWDFVERDTLTNDYCEPLDMGLEDHIYIHKSCIHEKFDWSSAIYSRKFGCFHLPLVSCSSQHSVWCVPKDRCGEKCSMGSSLSKTPPLLRLKIIVYLNNVRDQFGSIDESELESELNLLKEYVPDKFIGYFRSSVEKHTRDIYVRRMHIKINQMFKANKDNMGRYIIDESGCVRDTWTFGRKCANVVSKFLGWMASFGGIIASLCVALITYVIFFYKKKDVHEVQPQLHASGDFNMRKQIERVRQKIHRPIPQASEDLNETHKGILKKISRNTVFLSGFDSKGINLKCTTPARCLGLMNKRMIILRHYLEIWEFQGMDSVSIQARDGNIMKTYRIAELEFHWFKGVGHGFVDLPASFPILFKDISAYFPIADKDMCDVSSGVIYEKSFKGSENIVDVFIESVDVIQVEAVPWSKEYKILDGYQYAYGGKGVCGSILLNFDLARPILGMHVAGVGQQIGYAQVIEISALREERAFEMIIPQLSPCDIPSMGESFLEGCLDEKIFQSRVSKIVRSEVFGVFPNGTEPAPLCPKDYRLSEPLDPLIYGVLKRCDPPREFLDSYLDRATKDVLELLCAKMIPILGHVKKLSPLQGAGGIYTEIGGYEPGYEQLTLSTSEGYPWVKTRPIGCTGKRYLFDVDENNHITGLCEKLSGVLIVKEELRKRCQVPSSIFTCSLKDARILKEKVSIGGKTRVFDISPVDLSIAQRQLFLHFTSSYQRCNFECENTIGINVNGSEWAYLFRQLDSFSANILTGDYSSYGPRLPSKILFHCFRIINEWFTYNNKKLHMDYDMDIDNLQREVMSYEIINGLHAFSDVVFRPTCGLPSGNVMTVHLNSLANSIIIRYVFLHLAEGRRLGLTDFYKYVKLYHNGDDLIIGVSEEIISWFNNLTISACLAIFGIKYTSADKGDTMVAFTSIYDAQYLKCKFLLYNASRIFVLAALDQVSIFDTANYVQKSLDHRGVSLLNSDQCVRLAYGHGKDFFDKIRLALQEAWAKKKVFLSLPTWKELHLQVWQI